MSNPFFLPKAERLAHWKEFRNSLSNNDFSALQAVCQYFAVAPIGPCDFDIFDPASWPSPWEMVNTGDWNNHNIAVGMEMTLRLAGWDQSKLRILHFRDYDRMSEITVLVVDEKYMLNYTIGDITDYPPNAEHVVQASWQYNGREYSEK